MEPIIGLLTAELYIGEAQSLKDKRSVVNSVLQRLANRFNVAVAEIDLLDDHCHAVIAVTTVANERRFVSQMLEAVQKALDTDHRAVLEAWQTEII
jgi:uncharacterized protein YlxP (DUF503 family)